MSKDLYSKPFDEGTKFKLTILENYLEEWLPVFTRSNSPFTKNINIFDYFSGEGQDSIGNEGSSLIILRILKKFKPNSSELKINLYLNEFNKNKFELLKKSIEKVNLTNIKINLSNLDFEIAFNNFYPKMNNSANFLFLDQCGVKFITKEIFSKIINLSVTDFLFFISSSYFNRFINEGSFNKFLNITKDDINKSSYSNIHRDIFNYYKKLIPDNKNYFIAPFSIKKKANIYGLIFGTNHPLGIFKFLDVCWKKDKLTGEANFDIDTDKIDLNKPSLFPEDNKPKKFKHFENEIVSKILNKELTNEKELILFGLESGFLPKHIKPTIKKLIEQNKIEKFNFKISRDIIKSMSDSNILKLK